MPNAILRALMRRVDAIQLTVAELRAIIEALHSPPHGSFLLFGLGNDSPFWKNVHTCGRTVFLEDHLDWMEDHKRKRPELDVRLVECVTKLSDWQMLLDDRERLAMSLPGDVTADKWRVVLIDAPAGCADDKLGRMKSVLTAGELARRSAERGSPCDVFVHDCDREVERAYCDRWLTECKFVRQTGTLRHYRFTPNSSLAPSES